MRPQWKPLFHILPLEENANAEAERILWCALISLDDQRIRTSKCTAESREMLPAAVDTAWACTYTLSTLWSPALTVALRKTQKDPLITNTIYIICLLFFQVILYPYAANTLEHLILIHYTTSDSFKCISNQHLHLLFYFWNQNNQNTWCTVCKFKPNKLSYFSQLIKQCYSVYGFTIQKWRIFDSYIDLVVAHSLGKFLRPNFSLLAFL